MTKQQLRAIRQYFNLVHGVTLRAIGALSDTELDFRPKAGMRTPRELVFHIYSQEKILAEAAKRGRFTLERANGPTPEAPAAAASLGTRATVADTLAYAS